jgi:hypothetical protein
MKIKKRIPRHPLTAPRVDQESDLSNMETINEIENEMADDSDRESIEAVERDYDGRSSNEEDGAIPMDPADHDPIPRGGLRRPSRPPRHNI